MRFSIPKIKICLLALLLILAAVSSARAAEFVILYTAETHAMIYPCNCPLEPDGGIARRSTLIKQHRSENPRTLVLDAGSFFAGGLMDEYTQNSELDMRRTLIQLKAMEMMGYDAVNLESDEFNFGRDFLEKNIKKTKIPFLSCNVKSALLKPYIIKEIGGLKFGITGVTSPAAAVKAAGLEFAEPEEALRKTLAQMKKEGADVIVLLSQLGEKHNTGLIQKIGGIDIIIDSHGNNKDDLFAKTGSTLIVKTSWQGRQLGRLTLDIENKKIVNYKTHLLQLSDKVKDEPAIAAILPRCFSDLNCKKGASTGSCQNPGENNAQCAFAPKVLVALTVINHRDCTVCDTQKAVEYLTREFPGITASYIYYGSPEADKLINDFGIQTLPAYLLGKEAEHGKNFDNLRGSLEPKGDYYLLKPQLGGMSYFLNRKKIKGRVDVFLSLYDANAAVILENIRSYQPVLHFLATEQGGDDFGAIRGTPEVEEYRRSVCVQKYSPRDYWGYITCRARRINSSWWQECAPDIDTTKISVCARGREGAELLRENTALNKELGIMFGPTYLLENREIFGVEGVPSQEEFRKIFKK